MASRDCYSAMGPVPQNVTLTGGAARSDALRATLAAALGATVRRSSRAEAGAAGAAMIAAVGIGAYSDMSDCVAEWVHPTLTSPEPPDPALVDIYDRVFPQYVAARDALTPIWHAMAEHKERMA